MSDTTTQNIVTTNIPLYAEGYWKQNIEDLKSITDVKKDMPLNPNERVQDRTDLQRQGDEVIKQMPGDYNPMYDRAAGTAGNIENFGYQVAAGNLYDPTDYENKGFTQDQYNQTMNPFVGNVLDRAQSRATDRFNEQQMVRDQQAAKTGSFGGSRQYVTNAMAQRDLNNQLSDLEATQLSEAFKNAQGFLGQQRQLGEASKQFDVGTSLKGADILGMGANLDINTAVQRQRSDISTADAMLKAGAEEQEVGQAKLNVKNQDFLNQRDWDLQNALTMNGALRGMPTPTSSSGTSSNTRADTSIWNQIGGAAIAGAGALAGNNRGGIL